MTRAREIARARKGVRSGSGWLICCPLPSHGKGRGDRSPSLSIADGADGRLLVRCHAGCDSIDVLDEFRRQELLEDRHGDDRPRPAQRPVIVKADDDADERKRRDNAARMWGECVSPIGTPVETYLASRGLDVKGVTDSIKFHPKCALRDDDGARVFGQAMVCAMRHVSALFDYVARERLDVEEMDGPRFITAVHRTALTVDGQKRFKARQMLGVAKGAAVMFDDVCSVLDAASVIIAEGVETALSMRAMSYWPVWALGNAGAIAAFEPLPHVNKLIIAGENDTASRVACDACAKRWLAAGRLVSVMRPRQGKDANDILTGARHG